MQRSQSSIVKYNSCSSFFRKQTDEYQYLLKDIQIKTLENRISRLEMENQRLNYRLELETYCGGKNLEQFAHDYEDALEKIKQLEEKNKNLKREMYFLLENIQ